MVVVVVVGGCLEINTSCFLSRTGSATVAVPLSLGAQAAPREEDQTGGEERETAVRTHKGRGRRKRVLVGWVVVVGSYFIG